MASRTLWHRRAIRCGRPNGLLATPLHVARRTLPPRSHHYVADGTALHCQTSTRMPCTRAVTAAETDGWHFEDVHLRRLRCRKREAFSPPPSPSLAIQT